jgi:uncharacterized protein (DUF1800 family)
MTRATRRPIPDENYAREVMQLFTIGLYQLNPDGSQKTDAGGNPIPTYSNTDVMGMAAVFTGLQLANTGRHDGSRMVELLPVCRHRVRRRVVADDELLGSSFDCREGLSWRDDSGIVES